MLIPLKSIQSTQGPFASGALTTGPLSQELALYLCSANPRLYQRVGPNIRHNPFCVALTLNAHRQQIALSQDSQ